MRQLNTILLGAALGLASTMLAHAQDASGGGPQVSRLSDDGKQIYEDVCQACHMANAEGAEGGAPGLAHNSKLAYPNYPIVLLLKGKGAMPGFTRILTPAQMAAVVTYVRSHFNNYSQPVTEADVKHAAATLPPG